MDSELPVLNPAEARMLGCLAEKKELTPDVYPMTLNGLQSAANQKTARDPVMALEPDEIRRDARPASSRRAWCGRCSPRGSSATNISWRSASR